MTRGDEPTGPIGPIEPAGPPGPATPTGPDERGGCPRVAEAGAYLLGSLTPAERADYASHLATCPICLGEVGQLAGLPGLLARSPGPPPGAWLAAGVGLPAPPPRAPGEPPEPSAVAGALAAIRRERSRRRALLAAAFLLVAGVGVGATTVAANTLSRPVTGVSAAANLPVPMETLGNARVTAALALTDRPWGTEVVMRCRYQDIPDNRAPVYTLVATATDGATTELARWTAIPNEDVVLATATDLNRQRLTNLEVRNQAGSVVLRTQHI